MPQDLEPILQTEDIGLTLKKRPSKSYLEWHLRLEEPKSQPCHPNNLACRMNWDVNHVAALSGLVNTITTNFVWKTLPSRAPLLF
jgi:hypothetical protein